MTVSDYAAGHLVEGTIVEQLKTVKTPDRVPTAQSTNHLKATGRCVCLLLDGGATPRNSEDCGLTSVRRNPSVCIGVHLWFHHLAWYRRWSAKQGSGTTDAHR
jgi:hypothetical protein